MNPPSDKTFNPKTSTGSKASQFAAFPPSHSSLLLLLQSTPWECIPMARELIRLGTAEQASAALTCPLRPSFRWRES